MLSRQSWRLVQEGLHVARRSSANVQKSSIRKMGLQSEGIELWQQTRRSPSFWPLALVFIASGSAGGLLLSLEDAQQDGGQPKKKLLVLGTGWGGVSFLKNLDSSLYDVTVVSPRNYFVFTPLLPSVTAGLVEARSIAEPIRRIVNKNVHFYEAECVNIDAKTKTVTCKRASPMHVKFNENFCLQYDYLVVAVGAQTNTFGTPGVVENCRFLKEIEDADRIHQDIVNCFETASLPGLSMEDRKRLLTFVVIGGGPTGVEFAAELHDLVFEDLVKLYPVTADLVQIAVIQSADHILNMFDERLSKYAESKFQRDGLNVLTGQRVKEVHEHELVMLDQKTGTVTQMPYSMAVWSTGISTRPVVAHLMEQIGQKDRRVLATDEWLRVKGGHDIYALGDCATIEQRKLMEDVDYIFKLADTDNSGKLSLKEFEESMEQLKERYPQIGIYLQRQHIKNVTNLFYIEAAKNGTSTDPELDIGDLKDALRHVDSQMKAAPATAQVAAQEGAYLANCFNNKLKCESSPEGPLRIRKAGRHQFKPFQYKHFGQFAPLGGEKAVAELPGDWLSMGRSTMWLWYSVYLSKQVSWRMRALVLFDWTKRLLFGRDSTRM